MSLKSCVSTLAFNNLSDAEQARQFFDIDALEIIPRDLKYLSNEPSVSIQSIMFGSSASDIFKSDSSMLNALNHLKALHSFLYNTGIKNLVFGSPKIRNVDSAEDLKRANKFFKVLSKEYKNCIISIEPNPAPYGTNFLNTSKDTFDYVNKLNISNVKVNLDLGAAIYNGELPNDIINSETINFINHVHVSSMYLLDIESNVDYYRECIKLLDSLNYDKYVSLEIKSFKDIFSNLKTFVSLFD